MISLPFVGVPVTAMVSTVAPAEGGRVPAARHSRSRHRPRPRLAPSRSCSGASSRIPRAWEGVGGGPSCSFQVQASQGPSGSSSTFHVTTIRPPGCASAPCRRALVVSSCSAMLTGTASSDGSLSRGPSRVTRHPPRRCRARRVAGLEGRDLRLILGDQACVRANDIMRPLKACENSTIVTDERIVAFRTAWTVARVFFTRWWSSRTINA